VRALRAVAALRASTRDRSDEARRARRRLIDHADARVSATAMVALALAEDSLPAPLAITWLRNAAWPRGPAASFVLARAVARKDASIAELDPCTWHTSDEPITRHNLLVARAQRPSGACLNDRSSPLKAGHFEGLSPLRAGEPAALRLEDSTVLVSIPDASGRIGWPGLSVVKEVSAFLGGDEGM
jgi:hypothetical protein